MNIKYFEIAKKIATTLRRKRDDGKKNKYRVVALLIPRVGNEIFVGTNKMDKTHGGSPHPWKSIHAEFDAILKVGRGYKARKKIEGCDIYIYRETSYGQALAKPCPVCFEMLKDYNVKNIFYSAPDGFYSYVKGKVHGS